MGGEITTHSHPQTVTLDQYHRMQQLEDVRFVSADYAPTREIDYVFVDATTGAVDIQLPDANAGQHITISRITGTFPVHILPAAGETVNGQSSVSINADHKPQRLKAIKGIGYLEV